MYAPLLYVVPPNINPAGVGFDLLSSPNRAVALRKAAESGTVTVSEPVQLLSGGRGVNATLAVRRSGSIGQETIGYISAGMDIRKLIRKSARINTESMGVIVRDLSTPRSNRLLDVVAQNAPMYNAARAPDIPASTLNKITPYSLKIDIPVDGRTWQLEFVPTDAFLAGSFTALDWILLVAGIMVGLSTSSFVLFIAGSSMATEREIASRITELRATEQRMETLIDTAGEAFVSIDSDGIVQDWNPEATHMFGWTHEEAVGTELATMIIPEHMRASHRTSLAAFDPHAPSNLVDHRIEMPAVRRDGTTIQVEMLVTMLELHGDRSFHAFLHDISARKQLEEDQRQATELKTHFVAMASHEMRTPLTSIIGYAQTLIDRWDTLSEDQKRQFVRIISEQGDRFAQLIEDLLTISQIESGKLRARPEPADVAIVINQALADTEARAQVECSPGLTATIGVEHLRQILINFIRNAQKYGSPPLRVRAYTLGDETNIEVADEGAGVPAEFEAHLFERFSQAHRGATGASRGVGLGLSIVQALAETYGGRAWYRPNEPHGAVFGVTLPTGPS